MRLKLSKRNITAIIVALVALVAIIWPELAPGASVSATDVQTTYKTIVTSIYDGDTIHAVIDGRDESIRLIGIDTPELDDGDSAESAKEARDYTIDAVTGHEIWVVTDVAKERDRYGRLLAYIWYTEPPKTIGEQATSILGGTLNGSLVRDGMADALSMKPNVTFADRFEQAAVAAQEAGAGLWPSGVFYD